MAVPSQNSTMFKNEGRGGGMAVDPEGPQVSPGSAVFLC